MNRDSHSGFSSVPVFTTSMRASYCGGICHSGTSSKCGLIATYSKCGDQVVIYHRSERVDFGENGRNLRAEMILDAVNSRLKAFYAFGVGHGGGVRVG